MILAGAQLLLKTKRLTESAKLPVRNNPSDAGLDLYADEDKSIVGSELVVIKTGIALEIPYGTVGLILDRSSMGMKGLTVLGGVIDSDYRGEIKVILGKVVHTELTKVEIKKGDKIAQLVILPIFLPQVYEVEELTETERGDKGFGSSGV